MRKLLTILFVSLSIASQAQSPLCASTATNFGYEYVASITINGRTFAGNTGYSGPGYYDYTNSPVPTINAGQSINISYTAQTNGNYQQYFKLWIDFNGNGNLTDPGELVHSTTYTWVGTKVVNATFTVPTSVFNGNVYMRFIMVYSSSPTICGNYSFGNTFDFKTNIVGAQPNPNQPPTETIGGKIFTPVSSPLPSLAFYKVKANGDSLIQTRNVNADGTYSFTIPTYNSTYKLTPSFNPTSFITSADFNAVFNETQNYDAPPSLAKGLVMAVPQQWKAADINKDGIVNMGDAYLIGTHLSGFRNTSTEVLWFTQANYESITVNNFNTIQSQTSFIINFITTNVVLNIKYCILGDVNLSHSSQ